MNKICFITGTRADYGIMAPIMKNLRAKPDVTLQIIATNMHLSPRFGMTVNEIEDDGFHVDGKIESLADGDSASSMLISMSLVEQGLAHAFEELRPDLIVILGDRYEALAAASAAVVFNIPIDHLHGGEITEGAIDDKFRNAITKLSDYHFASTYQYAQRIVGMGAIPEHVFHSGAPGAEMIADESEQSAKFKEISGFDSQQPFILVAMHPVTLSPDNGVSEVKEVVKCLKDFIPLGYKILVTMPNSDTGHVSFFDIFRNWQSESPQSVVLVNSLGASLFHYAMTKASAMIGNSSAALIEAPSRRLPAVNVGIRQRGRASGITVLNSLADAEDIKEKLVIALSSDFKNSISKLPVTEINPYYKENSTAFIADTLCSLLKSIH